MTDTTDKLIIQSETRGVQQTTDQVKGLGDALGGVQKQSEQTERSTVSLEQKFAGLERRFGTADGRAAQFAKVQETVNKAVAQNPALQERANQILAAAEARYIGAGKAAEVAGKSTGLASYQLVNLSRQLQDVGVSLAGGQSPFTVLVQQGSQIADVFSTGNVTARGFFNQIAEGAGKILTPARLAVGGILGVGAAALYLGNSWQEAAAEVDRALTGIGAKSGTTAADINNFAKANSSAAGLSRADARSIAIEFAKTGEIVVSSLHGAGEAIRGYSLLTGKDATEATKDFVDAINRGASGIIELDRRYGALNASSIEYIRTLVDQDEKTKALQVFVDATVAANKRAEDSVGSLSRAWTQFKNIISNIVAGPGPTSLEEQLAHLQRQRAQAASTNAIGAPGGYLNTTQVFAGKAAELEEFDRKIAEVQQKLNDFNAQKAATEINSVSKAADAAVQAIFPQIDAIRQLDEAIRKIEEAKAKGVAPANADNALAVYRYQRDLQQESMDMTIRQAHVVNQLKEAYGGVSTQTAVTLSHLSSQLAVAQQVTGAGQMQAQAAATYNQLLLQGVSAQEASLIASQQLAVAQAAATSSVLRQVQAVKDQRDMLRAQQNGTEAITAASIAYRNAIESGASFTAAAALRAETLALYMERANAAAAQMGTYVQNVGSTMLVAGLSTGSGMFDDSAGLKPGFTSSFHSTKQGNTATSIPLNVLMGFLNAPNTDQIISRAVAGGVESGLSNLKNTTALEGQLPYSNGIFLPGTTYANLGVNQSQSGISNAVSQLYDLKILQAGKDNAAKIGIYQDEIAYLQRQKQTIDVMMKIAQLKNSIEDLKDATNANTQAQMASLNPLYSGRGALQVGYYKAATGLDVIAQGPTAGDQVPFHAMVNGGERITITPAGQKPATNDNSRTIINNNNFVFNGSQSRSRRSARQAAQGYGQMIASLS